MNLSRFREVSNPSIGATETEVRTSRKMATRWHGARWLERCAKAADVRESVRAERFASFNRNAETRRAKFETGGIPVDATFSRV